MQRLAGPGLVLEEERAYSGTAGSMGGYNVGLKINTRVSRAPSSQMRSLMEDPDNWKTTTEPDRHSRHGIGDFHHGAGGYADR